MTDQWIELNGEIYAVAMSKAKKRPRYNPGRLYQGNAMLGGIFRKFLSRWIRK